jgi:hypothetical protein
MSFVHKADLTGGAEWAKHFALAMCGSAPKVHPVDIRDNHLEMP